MRASIPFFVIAVAALFASAVAQSAFTCAASEPAVHTGATQILGWGTNWNGQLGAERSGAGVVSSPSLMFVGSNAAPRFSKVSGGLQHTMIIEESEGKAFVAGDGAFAQLGGGVASTRSRIDAFFSWDQVLLGNAPQRFTTKVLDVAAGWYSSCALLQAPQNPSTTQIFCSGRNNRGQLGNNSVRTQIAFPIPVDVNSKLLAAGESFVKIAAGVDHMAAVTSESNVFTWGAGASGELGTGNKVDSFAAVKVPAFPTRNGRDVVEDLQCGFRFCIALSSGTLYGWGLNTENQLGGASTEQVAATPVAIISGVTKFSVGGAHVLAIVNGRLHCWGSGTMGQCGVPKTISEEMREEWTVARPTPIPAFADVNVRSIAAGHKHSIVLDNCGTVYAMGAEALGQLGTGSQGTSTELFRKVAPVEITAIRRRGLDAIAVYASAFNSFVVGKI